MKADMSNEEQEEISKLKDIDIFYGIIFQDNKNGLEINWVNSFHYNTFV